MTDRPILFSAPMIRALLDGRKTQTRRVLNPQPAAHMQPDVKLDHILICRNVAHGLRQDIRIPYAHGDRLWVRETWNVPDAYLEPENRQTALGIMIYAATPWAIPGRWRPSIFMPRWASRLTLTVTDVRVQRLQEISEADAIAEGIGLSPNLETHYRVDLPMPNELGADAVDSRRAATCFRRLWDSLNAKRGFGWDANPWVAAYSFTVHHCNIDQMEARDG